MNWYINWEILGVYIIINRHGDVVAFSMEYVHIYSYPRNDINMALIFMTVFYVSQKVLPYNM